MNYNYNMFQGYFLSIFLLIIHVSFIESFVPSTQQQQQQQQQQLNSKNLPKTNFTITKMTNTQKIVANIETNSDIVPLHYRQNNINNNNNKSNNNTKKSPPILFIHGLDSSSQTWTSILDNIPTNYPSVAIDCRGCGYSPLGNENNFSPESIVQDIYHFMQGHLYFQHCFCNNNNDDKTISSTSTSNKVILCGHSMGGRIAMSFAKTYPQLVAALIIEDMDIRQRPGHFLNRFTRPGYYSNTVDSDHCDNNHQNTFKHNLEMRLEIIQFDRNLTAKNEEDVIQIFMKEGYPKDSVQKWLKEGRVQKKQRLQLDDNAPNDMKTFYSEVNPAFRLLCFESFFETDHGEETWTALAKDTNFPIHLFIAGSSGTVCSEESISQMKTIMSESYKIQGSNECLPPRFFIHRFSDAGHSIHNSAQKAFLHDLDMIVLSNTR